MLFLTRTFRYNCIGAFRVTAALAVAVTLAPGCSVEPQPAACSSADACRAAIPAKAEPFGLHVRLPADTAAVAERLAPILDADPDVATLRTYFDAHFSASTHYVGAVDPHGEPLLGTSSRGSSLNQAGVTAVMVALYRPTSEGSLSLAYAYIEERSSSGLTLHWAEGTARRSATFP